MSVNIVNMKMFFLLNVPHSIAVLYLKINTLYGAAKCSTF